MFSRLRTAVAAVTGAAVIAGGGLFVTSAAQAAPGCRVQYSVNQWSNGFTGTVSITNLGDPLTSWTLEWNFAGNQQITQSWNSTYQQTGQHVALGNASYNGSLGTNATVSPGFNANVSGTNASPASFTLNGTTCTGSVTPTPTTPGPTTPGPTPWNPPSNLVQPLSEVWQHVESTYPNLYGFRNYGWDQIMANGGFVNYCVRWDSSQPVSAALRDQVQATLQRQFKKWMDVMVESSGSAQGWNNWPYTNVPVRVVGWAGRDRAQLQWTDNSVDIYVNNIRENAPQCSEPCGRFFHQDGNYSGCPGGASHHYDMSLWLTSGFGGGAGGDWGQRIGSEYYVDNLNAENVHILLHEMGHTFGLDDFYDWTPTGQCCFLMKAGTAAQITPFDAWMFRDWWRHLKSRYGR
ncbi:cellulose-binding domain-containing protein [Flindersiella endophytica]